VLARPDR
jgi:hypothetical protein